MGITKDFYIYKTFIVLCRYYFVYNVMSLKSYDHTLHYAWFLARNVITPSVDYLSKIFCVIFIN